LILAVGAVFAGLIPFGSFVSADGNKLQLVVHYIFSIAPVSLGLAGLLIAAILYRKENNLPERIISFFGKAYQWAYNKFYIDEIYQFVTKKVLFNLVGRPAAWFDRNIVDGAMNGSAVVTSKISFSLKFMQSGRLQGYTMWFLGGILVIAIIIIYRIL
jgi:NADH-quinone oxidoreductase subunit L